MSVERKTAISWAENGRITIRGRTIDELIAVSTFAETIYLVLRGEQPDKKTAAMFEAVLISVIDHGPTPPSTIAAVTAANTGATLNAAVAAGLLAINKFHGGAIEDCMTALSGAVALQEKNDIDADEAAINVAEQFRARGERVSGFGHREHKADPRTTSLFAKAAELGFEGKFVEQARAFESALSKITGKSLPINADGAIAAVLCEIGFEPAAANGIFMIARLPGLVAHVIEEKERNPPMRTVDVSAYKYDGS